MPRVPRCWSGETVVCMASGPSLTAEVCEQIRGRARVIAVNDAVRLAPWADVLYSSDRQWWPRRKGVPSFSGPKYGIGSTIGKANPFHGLPEITVLRNTGYLGLELEPNGLRNGQNSGYAAINLAVHFGAARILLVGYDMGIRGGMKHFFGDHPDMNNPSEAQFVSWRRNFKSLVEPLRALGVEVVNCTPGSSLEAFSRAELAEALPPALEVA